VDATINYVNTGKTGNIPFGAYLQIPVEVPLPIESRTNDVRTALEWGNAKGMLRVGWDGSWYDNQAPHFSWDNPQRAVDASTASSQGRMAEWPSKRSVNVGGVLPPSRLTSTGPAIGRWNQRGAPAVHGQHGQRRTVPLLRSTAEAGREHCLGSVQRRHAATRNRSERPLSSYDFDNGR
jgi:hypothetical protein